MDLDLCWNAVSARDRSHDGRFLYGVVTTGVYCRPSCPSRLPLRRNVRFFERADEARAAGLRPCKRCRPDDAATDPATERIHELCRWMRAHSAQTLSLSALARRAHLSPFHFQRRFKAVTGVSPRQYLETCRLEALKDGLRDGASVTSAIYDAGFGSPSRVYEGIGSKLGMTPKTYRAGGAGVEISWASAVTPLGTVLMGATDRGLCFVQFGSSEDELVAQLRSEFPGALLAPMPGPRSAQFEAWMRALSAHFEGGPAGADLPLDLRGTAFQMQVWRYLQTIPAGAVQSYAEVAHGIGRPSAVRAVARACASNRVAVLIPCHRVIRGDGGLGGYRWGLERKRALLDQERAAARE